MRRFTIATAITLLTPASAYAHTGSGIGHDFGYGLMHPFGGIDHMLAMLGVGVLAALLGGKARWRLPLAFLAMLLVGFVLGASNLSLPLAEIGIAASVVGIGCAIVLIRSMSMTAAMALVGAFAVFHGYAHGVEIPAGMPAPNFVIGFVLAAASLHAMGVAATGSLLGLSRHRRLISRIAGSAIAVSGLGLLVNLL